MEMVVESYGEENTLSYLSAEPKGELHGGEVTSLAKRACYIYLVWRTS